MAYFSCVVVEGDAFLIVKLGDCPVLRLVKASVGRGVVGLGGSKVLVVTIFTVIAALYTEPLVTFTSNSSAC